MRERILRNLIPIDEPAEARWPPSATAPANEPRPSTDKTKATSRAAVLVPIVQRREGLSVLLTLRSSKLRRHAGQISFPGGRPEPDDTGPVATALRETFEETGIAAHMVEPLGFLDRYLTGTGFSVTPVVSLVDPRFVLSLDAAEVEEAFEVPLDFFMRTSNRRFERANRDGVMREFYVYEYGPRYIWGATAGMLVDLVERLDQTEIL